MAATKRLTRNGSERVLLGVCAGLGDYFNVDPVLVRVVYTLLTLATGVVPGAVVYLLFAALMPQQSRPNV